MRKYQKGQRRTKCYDGGRKAEERIKDVYAV